MDTLAKEGDHFSFANKLSVVAVAMANSFSVLSAKFGQLCNRLAFHVSDKQKNSLKCEHSNESPH